MPDHTVDEARPAVGVAPGRVLGGRYELAGHVASGGMASVWQATDRVLDRRVAVKILHAHLAADPTFLARFRAEGRAAARLSHASVVAIFDTVSEPDCEAIVMELVEGETLRSFLDTHGPRPVADAVSMIDQVAGAIEAAHDAGIVHRDIKPGNILLCPDRGVKVTDFGIAKAAAGTDHTADGMLLGTAKYLAPEQVAGQSVDGRADLYSLGVVLYEILTGTVPFDAETPAATALARLDQEPPSVTTRRRDLPPQLVTVIDTLLAREPGDRYPTAAAVRGALAGALVPPPPVIDPTIALPDQRAPDPATSHRDSCDPARSAPVPRAANGSRATPRVPDPVVVGDRDPLRAVVVGVVVLGTLVLGIGLLAATAIGRDLYERIRSGVADTIVDDRDDAAQPPPSPDQAAGGDPAAVPVADTVANVPEANADRVPIIEVTDFDPQGDGREHSARAALAADDDPATFWHSERYDSRQFGNLKGGVGIVIAIDANQPLDRLDVRSPTRGWTGRVFVSDGAAADLAGWDEPIDGRVDVDGDARFDLRGVVGTHLLVWFTDLGDELPRPRIEVSELVVS